LCIHSGFADVVFIGYFMTIILVAIGGLYAIVGIKLPYFHL